MKNLFILLVVLVALVFGSKIYTESRYESKLDDLIAGVRFFADISYDNVEVGFDGSISLNGLSIKATQIDESLNVEKIRAISSDKLMAFNGFSAFKDGKFPETFDFSITQMDIPIAEIERFGKKTFSSSSAKSQCRNFSTSFNYTGAGYKRLVSDMRVAVDFSDIYNAVINLDGFDDTGTFELEWVFDASEVEAIAYGSSKQLPISEINVDYELAPDAAERFIKHCADEFKVTPEVYLQKVVGSSKYSENSFGSDFGPQVREALVKFMQGGSRLSLTSKPSSQLKKIEQLKFYKPQDILRWLNLTATIDGETLDVRESVLAAEEAAKAKSKEEKTSVESKYKVISIGSAKSYIGRRARISRTQDRKTIKGIISGISDEDRLMVDVYKHGGLMTLTVGEEEIERIEVLNK